MSNFICPVCKNVLIKYNNTLKCQNNHSFDISKFNYVNLLQSQQNSKKRHGDDKLMVKARKDFLDNGYYDPLLKSIFHALECFTKDNMVVFDSGCGECYYTDKIEKYLSKKVAQPTVCGIDIAKDAIIHGMKRNSNLELAVASVNNIPISNEYCDIILNFFAPISDAEYYRIAKENSKIIRVVPLKNHLWELKCNIYDSPYKNDTLDLQIDGFEIIDKQELKYEITVDSNEHIQNLFKMTPYYYKTSRKDQEKVLKLNTLTTKIEFGIIIYKKV